MKRILILILTLCAIAAAQDLPRIAVYVTGNVGNNEKKALGTNMLASLVKSGRYKTIERNEDFLSAIDKEQIKQRSGAIDDNQISTLGRQFGVKFVCIADITPALGEFLVSARIVDVETAVVDLIGRSPSQLKTMADLMKVSDEVVTNMFRQTVSSPAPTSTAQTSQSTNTFVDSRDGKTYKKVKIGNQTWMAENLNYDVPNIDEDKCYGNKSANCDEYGRLYNWSTAKNACPVGWHLPSDAEWTKLEKHIGGSKTAGKKLKSTRGWKQKGKKGNGTDEHGFSALPGGSGYGSTFYDACNTGYWWSATETSASNAWYRHMRYLDDNMFRYNHNFGKTNLFSVRCIAD